MSYPFPPDLAAQVQSILLSGRYASEDDLLREAIQALDRQDHEIAAIQAGLDDLDAGRVVELDEFDRAFRERNQIR